MNMKKLVAGILACCIVGGTMPAVADFADNAVITASAYTEGTYEQFTYKKYSRYVKISKFDGTSAEVVIPAEIEGLPVTEIGYNAFSGCTDLTSVTIPDSVTNIDTSAFSKCTALTSITIPDSVKSIGWHAFSDCTGLTSIELSNSITDIAMGVFRNCTGLTSITIPDSVTGIRDEAFIGCTGLTSITIPDSVTIIGPSAFNGCASLQSITIPDSVTSIGAYALFNTPWFEEKQKENPLVIAGRVLIDGRECSGDVVIPDGVVTIESNAFDNCAGITSVTIPASVTNIRSSFAFWGCTNLLSVSVSENNADYSALDGVLFNKDKTILVKYPDAKAGTEYIIPESVTNIEDGVFANCKNLEKIIIPEGVVSIGDFTFENTRLTSITLPDGVKSIGQQAFRGCTSLTSVTIPDSVEIVKGWSFSDTPWLEAKQKENPLVIVGNSILIDGTTCSGDIVIPDGVKSIQRGAFYKCTGITSATIPASVASIEELAFSYCTELTSVKILNPECYIFGGSSNTLSSSTNTTVYGYENSTAQEYAQKNRYNFESLGEAPTKETVMGDVSGDDKIDASDASLVLAEYALISTDGDRTFTETMNKSADINGDGKIDSTDASLILGYYSYTSTGGTDTLATFLESAESE